MPIEGVIHWDIPPDQNGYGATLAPNSISTPVENGAAKYRQIYVGGSSDVRVQWTLDQDEYFNLVALVETVLCDGVLPFTLDLILRTGVPLRTYTVYIRPGTFRLRSQRGLTYVVVATLEVLRDPEQDELDAANALLGIVSNNQRETYINLLEQIVNVTLDISP